MYPVQDVASCIGIPDLDFPDSFSDSQFLRHRRETAVPPPERARAEQVVRSQEFVDWLQSPTSTQLLVIGDYGTEVLVSGLSGLSFLCLSLADVLLAYNNRFIPLVFFCGRNNDPPSGHALIRSLIHQLLVFRGMPGIPISPDDLNAVHSGDLGALNRLFASIVSLIPPGLAVCCLIDGASHYEREEFWGQVQSVLGPLLHLSGQSSPTHASLKLLITSPRSTSLWEWFPEDSVLSMAARGWDDQVPSTDRLRREVANAIDPRRSSSSPEP